jgi:predicted permease
VIVHDLRHAARSLARRPGLTLAALLSLALGIGVNTAIFSVFEQVVLRRLPVVEPDRLVNVTSPGPRRGRTSSDLGLQGAVFSYPLFRDLTAIDAGFTGIAAFREFRASLASREETSSGQGMLVSGSYFPTLGLSATVGRLLTPDDDRTPGAQHVAVLSHAYWSARFGASPTIVGDRLTVNGHPLTIVGVAPPGFSSTSEGDAPQVFVPLAMTSLMTPDSDLLARGEGVGSVFENRRDHWLYVFARLGGGVTPESAQDRMNLAFAGVIADLDLPAQSRMSDQVRAQYLARRVLLEEGSRGHRTGGDRGPLMRVLFGVTALVLLIACANVANLLLARAGDRAAEIAVHVSMGATPGRILTRLLTETTILAVAGGVAGLAVANTTLRLLSSELPAQTFEPNGPVLFFTIGLSLATGVLFGLAPALHAIRAGLSETLKAQSGQASTSRVARRFGRALATVQIALATALLAQTGLFIKSLVAIGRVDLGIRAEDLTAFRVSPGLNGYDAQRSLALFEQVEDQLAALPGVSSVTATSVALLTSNNSGTNVTVEGFEPSPDANTSVVFARVGPDYFRTLGIPLIAGREFTRNDAGPKESVAIVNETFASKFGLGTTAVGRRMRIGAGRPLDIEIVGLARDARYSEVKEPPPPQFVVPFRQTQPRALTFYVRSSGDPRPLLTAIPAAVHRVDKDLPIENLSTMVAQVQDNVSRDRLLTTVSSAFGVLATLLAALGLYGVLAHAVAQRRREIGIRMAIGATGGRIRRMVLSQLVPMATLGCVTGVVVALAFGRVAASLLFGLEGHDASVIGAAVAAVVLVSFAAGIVPAYRASRIDPVVTLRSE